MEYFTTSALLQAFQEAGIPKSWNWIYRTQRSGNLVLPKDPSYHRISLTQDQINEIVDAFKPGSTGSWSYK